MSIRIRLPDLRRWLSPIALVLLWQVASATGLLPPDKLSSPSTVFQAGVDTARSGELGEAFAVSIGRVGLGFLFGATVALLLGIAAGLSTWGNLLIDPPVQMLRTLPFLGLIPLLILWFVDRRYAADLTATRDRWNSGASATGTTTTPATPGPPSSSRSSAGCGTASRSTSRGSTSASPVPGVYFGGSSPAALPVAARHADVYLTWGEPPAQVAEKIHKVRELAAGYGRTPRFGIRLHTISRDSSAEAWAEAGKLLDALDPEQERKAQQQLAASESVGQQRMVALHGGALGNGVRGLEIYPNLWAGVGLVRGGAGTALVGSHSDVADRIEEYHALGIDEFIFSGYPHLEEAYWFGEGVRPELARRGLLSETPARQLAVAGS